MSKHPGMFRRIIAFVSILLGAAIAFGGSNATVAAFQELQNVFDGNTGFYVQVGIGSLLIIGGVFGLLDPFARLYPYYLCPLLLYLFFVAWGVILMDGRGIAGLIVHVALYAITTIEMFSDRRSAKPQPPSLVVFHLQ